MILFAGEQKQESLQTSSSENNLRQKKMEVYCQTEFCTMQKTPSKIKSKKIYIFLVKHKLEKFVTNK